MKILQNEIRTNIWKSYLIMFLFILLISFLGFVIGILMNNWAFGLFIALLGAGIYSMIAYSIGDSMVLKMAGAKPLTKNQYPYVWHKVESLSIAAGIPKPSIYIIDSPAMNAFATGKKPEKSYVAVTTGLIKKMNRQELEGVLAHEISHIKNYDIRVMLLTTVLAGVIVFLSHIIFRMTLFGGMNGGGNRDRGAANIILIVIGIIFLLLSPLFAEMIKLAVSRRREYLADASGANLTRYPPGLASALEKIKKDSIPLKQASNATAHLFISNPIKKGIGKLFSTHPPIDERIRRLREM